jgi:ferredoxin
MLNVAFDIYLAWSDRNVRVPAASSALAALIAAGVPVEPGCMTGGCGCCALAYVEGDVIHKDTCLSVADRARCFCPCVSRALTRIVIAF